MILIEKQRIQKIAVVIRILRIIRLIRVVKLYKAATVFMTNVEIKRRIEKLTEKRRKKENIEKKKTIENQTDGRETKKNYTFKNDLNELRDCSVFPITKTRFNSENAELTIISKSKQDLTSNLKREDKLIELNLFNKKIEQIKYNSTDTRISRVVSESITKKVIIIIILMLLISPISDDNVYTWENNIGYLRLCKIMNNIIKENKSLEYDLNSPIYDQIQNIADKNFPIIEIFHNTTAMWTNKTLISNFYRYEEKSISYSNEGLIYVIYDNKHLTNILALLNIIRTVFVIFLLLYIAIVLNNDSKRLILKPIQIMKQMMDSIANDPINHAKIDNLKDRVKISMNKLNKIKDKEIFDYEGRKLIRKNNSGDAEYEIKILQLAIMKISALLAIGFGDAGGEILSENMRSKEGLNPMLPGKKKTAIFGFCDIRRFSDINIALQEKTIVLVNEIADIVHSSVYKFGGATNKNIGDAFLNVWKFDHLETVSQDGTIKIQELDEGDHLLNTKVADQSLLSFLTILKKINRSPLINAYRNNDKLKSLFGNDFKIEMGFGLHLGWAIEGAIGSFYKIDCSYLSPHVNISARLESATKQYGVKILLSGQLFDLLSDDLKKLCRLIDVVILKGSEKPVRLYTVYVNENLKITKDKFKSIPVQGKRNHFSIKKRKLNEFDCGDLTLTKFILNKKRFKSLLSDKKKPALFYDRFREGVCAYIAGDWEKALISLKDAFFLDEEDGPTLRLLEYIVIKCRKCPLDWKGFRELGSK